MGLFDNWFLRGAQSAVFYYVSCAPCVERARMKKAKGDAQRDRREREQLELEGLTLYADYEHQPAPFTTNPHWHLDLEPPSLPSTARSRKSQRKRTLSAQHNDSSQITVQDATDTPRDDGLARSMASPRLEPCDSRCATFVDEAGAPLPVPWNRSHNQRPDDEVWCYEYTTAPPNRLMPPLVPHVLPPVDPSISTTDHALSSPEANLSVISFATLNRPPTRAEPVQRATDDRIAPDLNDYVPPSIIFPERDARGNLWHRQPPPDRDFMDNKTHAVLRHAIASTSTVSLPNPGFHRTNSHRLSHSKADPSNAGNSLFVPTKTDISRTSTVRTTRSARTRSQRTATLDQPPNILDDDYIPPHEREAAEATESDETVDATSSISTSLPPLATSQDSSNPSLDTSDADSGVEFDTPSPPPTSGGSKSRTNPTRARLPRLSTAPVPLHPKPHLHTVASKTKNRAKVPKRQKAQPCTSDPNELWRAALAARDLDDEDLDLSTVLDASMDEHESDVADDPRWHWQSGRRWSADL